MTLDLRAAVVAAHWGIAGAALVTLVAFRARARAGSRCAYSWG